MRTLPIFLAFFLMGLADAMGPMSDAVGKEYHISKFFSTLMPFFVFIAFAVFSVPGGVLAARIGKKKLLLLGLGLNAVACLIPSSKPPAFRCCWPAFSCWHWDHVPPGRGQPDHARRQRPRRLQPQPGLRPRDQGLGSTSSTYLVTAVTAIAFFASMGWRGTFPLFFILMSIAFVGVLLVRVQETKADVPPSIGSSLGLLKQPIFALAVLGIFLYVGAESSMGTFLFPGLKDIG